MTNAFDEIEDNRAHIHTGKAKERAVVIWFRLNHLTYGVLYSRNNTILYISM